MIDDFETETRVPSTPVPSSKPIVLQYRLRLRDLYWFWETTPGATMWAVLFVPLGLLLLSTPLRSGDYPLREDVAIGAAALASAFVFGFAAGLTGDKSAPFVNGPIGIVVDDRGVSGWPVPREARQSWGALGRPRVERGVLILPVSWSERSGHVPIPANALTPAEFERVMTIARTHGYFVAGDARTRWGAVLAWIADLMAGRPGVDANGRMTAFPATRRRWALPGGRGALLALAGMLSMIGAWSTAGLLGHEQSEGLACLGLAAVLIGVTTLLAPWRRAGWRWIRIAASLLLLGLAVVEVAIGVSRILALGG